MRKSLNACYFYYYSMNGRFVQCFKTKKKKRTKLYEMKSASHTMREETECLTDGAGKTGLPLQIK